MEQNKINLDFPCNDRWIVENVVNRFSNLYSINITIEKEEDRDGVVFFTISSNQFTPNLIFEIGYYYNGYVSQLREKGKIDW